MGGLGRGREGPAHRPAEGVLHQGPRARRGRARSSRRSSNTSKLGATVVEVSLPNQALSVPVYYVIAPAEASSNLSRFDGVRYGHRAREVRRTSWTCTRRRAREGFGAEAKRRIMIGTYVLSHGYYDAYYLQAQKIRRLIARDFTEAFKQCDVIVGPAAPTVAFDLGAQDDGPGADVPRRPLHDPHQPRGAAGHVDSVRLRRPGAGRWGCRSSATTSTRRGCSRVAHPFQQATDWHDGLRLARCVAGFGD